MERQRNPGIAARTAPDCASLHPGYGAAVGIVQGRAMGSQSEIRVRFAVDTSAGAAGINAVIATAWPLS